MELRKKLNSFLNQRVLDPATKKQVSLGNYKFGVYAFFDYDGEPIYVGQTNERLRTRVRRHLTNQRTDAVAMKVLDPFEVYEMEVWPLFKALLKKSTFQAVLNEKDPPETPNGGYVLPPSWRGKVVSDEVFLIRSHPDTRIARRSETLSLLAKVISERQVQKGLRRTLLTQAKRLAWLAERRLNALANLPEGSEIQDEK
jgi:hypothetical protein